MKKLYILILIILAVSIFNNIRGNEFNSINLLDTTKPVIIHTPISNIPKVLWPVSVSAVVTDSSGIDSVWVKWYKNNPATMNRKFRLNNTGGNNYSALFNSVNPEVNYTDSIFYRIFAQDNSSNHNADSTPLYNFKIITGDAGCVGYDILPSNYPFPTYWMDARTQILLTASELNTYGVFPNMPISFLGFFIQSNSNQTMNGLCIGFKHTTLTTLNGFSEGGFTIGYFGNFTFNGTGRQNISMTNPGFTWNGINNLLIEICFDNSTYTTYTVVNSTYAPGMTWGRYTDNSSGCALTSGSSLNNRPNICFPYPCKLKNNSEVILKYLLSQNYPNPFNPFTRIDFDIPKKGFVILKVYDVLGREVQTLVNEEKVAGSYSVDFNASDLTSGVYFYKLEADGFSDVKRMILIK